jgi:hypothetical protein
MFLVKPTYMYIVDIYGTTNAPFNKLILIIIPVLCP